ncbi:unnamed protein product [Hapterophycus canaliculatus]
MNVVTSTRRRFSFVDIHLRSSTAVVVFWGDGISNLSPTLAPIPVPKTRWVCELERAKEGREIPSRLSLGFLPVLGDVVLCSQTMLLDSSREYHALLSLVGIENALA